MSVQLANLHSLRKYAEAPPDLFRAIGQLLTPVAVVSYVLAVWRLGADLDWMESFFITSGLLSHWQVWLALAILIQMMAAYLTRLADRNSLIH